MKRMIMFALATALAGCGGMQQTSAVWEKPGSTAEQTNNDHQQCNYDAKKAFYANINSPLMGRYLGQEIYDACMKARGYR